MIRTCTALFAVAILLCESADASLVLSSNHPNDGSAIPIVAGQSNVGTMTLTVFSNSGNVSVDDYYVGLRIVGRLGSTGSITFGGATQGSAPYVIPGSTGFIFLSPALASPSEASLGDDGFNAGNISGTIGASPLNIVNLTFNALPGTSGFFDVILINEPYAPTYFNDTAATAIPLANSIGTPIGVITAAVPEASAFAFGGLAMAMGGVIVWKRRKVAPTIA